MGRNKSYDREDALRKAMHAFWHKGFEATNLSDLVAATGLNKFSLYNEFTDKEHLFHECVKLYLADSDGYYDQVLNKRPLGMANIVGYFRSVTFHDDYFGCFFVRTLTDTHATPERTHRLVVDYVARIEGYFQANLEAARERGELAAERDLEATARYLVTADLGLSVLGIGHHKRESLPATVEILLRPLGQPLGTASPGHEVTSPAST